MKCVKAIYAVGLGLALTGLFTSCGDEEIVTVTPDPAIKVSVVATPNALTTGGQVAVQAQVTTNESNPLKFSWLSEGGKFTNATTNSTTWVAPDDPGVYSVSVVVTSGQAVGIGSAKVTVGTYLPAVTPFYRGANYCATCHAGGVGGDQYTHWSASAHAGAIEALTAIGQGNNANCLGCHTVGSFGLNADGALQNGGYDETAVARLAGVQCENCHGPGSEHPTPDAHSVLISLDAAVCGDCHNDAHHPTFDEWQTSAHNHIEDSPAGRASCAKCHNGLLAGRYLDNPEGWTNPATDPTEKAPIACAVCHDPHGNDNPGNLRDASVTDRSLPNAIIVENAGAGRLCMACHNGRRTETDVNNQINNGSAHLGPHHSVQGDMLAGVNAYENVDSTFAFATSKHILVQDACVTCHTHPHEGDIPNGIPNFTGHTFEPTVEACQPCHGNLSDFEEVLAKADYDGDGQVEGVQLEVRGLLAILEETIIEATPTEDGKAALRADFEGKVGDATITTREQRMAAYNWAFVSFDGSSGVHNATYAVQLLQRSILSLNPGRLPGTAELLVSAE